MSEGLWTTSPAKSCLGALAAGVIAAAVLLPANAAADQRSLDPAFTEALELRHLQTELMIAALSCGSASKANYNAFVERYRKRLVTGGRNLRRLFANAHGRRAQHRLDSFVTRLANESSRLSLRDKASFCARTGDTFAALLNGKDGTRSLDAQRALYRCRMTGGEANCSVVSGQMTAASGPELN